MTPEELTDDAIDYMLENLEWGRLNAWETSFCESIKDQWDRKKILSERQKEILGRIWDKQP